MTTSSILTILGIIFTILFGILSFYLIIKRRYSGQITFYKETTLALFDSLAKNFPELSVNYQNQPVNEGIVFLKGTILNTGAKDIDETMVKEKMNIELPDGFKWLSAKVISASSHLKTDIIVSEKNINISIELFRCNEFIRLEALAEVPIAKTKNGKKTIGLEAKLEKVIRINHRIADTQKVLIKDFPDPQKGYRALKGLLIPIVFVVIIGIGISISYYFKGWPVKTHYIMQNEKGVDTEVAISTIHNNIITIKGVKDKKFRIIMPKDDFLNQQKIKPILVLEYKIKYFLIMLGFYILITIIPLILEYKEQREGRKLRKLLSISQKNNL